MRTRGGSSTKPRMMPRSAIVSTGISGSGISSSTAMTAASSIFVATVAMDGNLHPFESERDSLADADAHGGERELAAAALKLLRRGQCEACARHAERVAERDRAAVGVHVGSIVGKAELPQDGERLGR